jgi:phosphoribosylamine--glycine ligase
MLGLMKLLVIGSGGREHALCWKLAKSPLVDQLYCAPGNAGIAELAVLVPLAVNDIDGIVGFAKANNIDFVVVGPEQPLVLGLVDRLEAIGIPAFGPTAAAARLEGSKGFMKDLCRRHDIPAARYRRFSDAAVAHRYLDEVAIPVVIKADGLAAGKGVTVATTRAMAEQAIDDALKDNRFGEAGAEIVIEEFLAGEEVSFFVLTDGVDAVPLASAADHKRAFDGDQGPNTGGMGAFSPAPALTPELEAEVMTRIIHPTIRAMAAAGSPFKGVLYAGLMLTPQGPKLIEYNVRFGDPECQALMLRLKSDLLPVLIAAREGRLSSVALDWDAAHAITVVMAARGYPNDPLQSGPIDGLAALAGADDLVVFHAATKRDGDRIIANGGRVLGVSALGADLAVARDLAYSAIDRIDFPTGFYRRDIGLRGLR